MLSPAFAYAWLLWRQHGRGLLVVLGYLLIAGAIPVVAPMILMIVPNDFSMFVLRNLDALVVIPLMPLLLLPFYMMVVFAYGLDVIDVSVRPSCFPARLFQLPVRTGALTMWPLAFGAAATVMLWLVIASCILWPLGRGTLAGISLGLDQSPLWWPGFLAAAALAWVQALLWSPFGLPWIRVVLLAVLLPIVIILANFGVHSGHSEASLVGLFVSLAAIAWTTAYIGVLRARGGAIVNWEWLSWPLRQVACLLPQRRMPFAVAAQAQTWYEWRCSRFALPITVGFGLALLLWPFLMDEPNNEFLLQAKYAPLVWSLGVPVFWAGIGSGWLGSGRHRGVKDPSGMSPFLATLPMSSAGMVAAMLRAAAWSTLAAWAVYLVIVSLVMVLTGHLAEASQLFQNEFGGDRSDVVAARIMAIAALLIVWTWKRKVCRLWLTMTGRKWLEVTLGWGRVPAYAGLLWTWVWINQQPYFDQHPYFSKDTIGAAFPWLFGLFMLCRLAAATWATRQVLRQGLLEAQTARRWIAGWVLVAAALFVVLIWAAPDRVPIHYLAFAVLFVMPMARLAATPLALAWNRHR